MIAVMDKQSGGVKYFKPDGTVTPWFGMGPMKAGKCGKSHERLKKI